MDAGTPALTNHADGADVPRAGLPPAASRPASATAPTRALVLADRVEQLYSQMWLGILMTFAIGAIATFELWEQRLQASWCCSGGASCCSSPPPAPAWSYAYRRAPDRATQPEQWLRWLGIAALGERRQLGLRRRGVLPLARRRAAGVPRLPARRHDVGRHPGVRRVVADLRASSGLGIVVPFTYVLATFGNRLFTELALLVPMFYAINVAIAYRLSDVFHSGYRLRHAYGRLTEDYSVLNQRLERQLVELEEARRQVEASGRKLALFAERAPIAVLELDPRGARSRR